MALSAHGITRNIYIICRRQVTTNRDVRTNSMTSTEPFSHLNLTKTDIPCMKLDTAGFDMHTRSVKELAECCGIRQTGKWAELLKWWVCLCQYLLGCACHIVHVGFCAFIARATVSALVLIIV